MSIFTLDKFNQGILLAVIIIFFFDYGIKKNQLVWRRFLL